VRHRFRLFRFAFKKVNKVCYCSKFEEATDVPISGRNKLFGKITEMRYDGLLAQISIEVGGQAILFQTQVTSSRVIIAVSV